MPDATFLKISGAKLEMYVICLSNFVDKKESHF